jgi:hypothetical protein
MGVPRGTGLASIRVERCYKGNAEGLIHVVADEYRPDGGLSGEPRFVFLKPGEYDLFFLSSVGEKFAPVKQRGSIITISRRTDGGKLPDDPREALRRDLEAGLQDPDVELVRTSIRLLGTLKSRESVGTLNSQLVNADELTRLYIWEALVKLGGSSVLSRVADYLDSTAVLKRQSDMPQDRVTKMQQRLYLALFRVEGAVAVPYQTLFVNAKDNYIRYSALQALRSQHDVGSAPYFLAALDDEKFENAFVAMMALIELAGGGEMTWLGKYEEMARAQPLFAAKCREWWKTEGAAKAKLKSVSSIPAVK